MHVINNPLEVQKTSRLADNPKRQRLVGGGLERAPLPFSGFQRAEPFGGYEVEKKRGQTSIVLELGHKFWVAASAFFRASLWPKFPIYQDDFSRI